MTEAELHCALADVARISRRGGYDVDEEAEVLARVVHAYTAARLHEVAEDVDLCCERIVRGRAGAIQ